MLLTNDVKVFNFYLKVSCVGPSFVYFNNEVKHSFVLFLIFLFIETVKNIQGITACLYATSKTVSYTPYGFNAPFKSTFYDLNLQMSQLRLYRF